MGNEELMKDLGIEKIAEEDPQEKKRKKVLSETGIQEIGEGRKRNIIERGREFIDKKLEEKREQDKINRRLAMGKAQEEIQESKLELELQKTRNQSSELKKEANKLKVKTAIASVPFLSDVLAKEKAKEKAMEAKPKIPKGFKGKATGFASPPRGYAPSNPMLSPPQNQFNTLRNLISSPSQPQMSSGESPILRLLHEQSRPAQKQENHLLQMITDSTPRPKKKKKEAGFFNDFRTRWNY